jgi:hypothetical protein
MKAHPSIEPDCRNVIPANHQGKRREPHLLQLTDQDALKSAPDSPISVIPSHGNGIQLGSIAPRARNTVRGYRRTNLSHEEEVGMLSGVLSKHVGLPGPTAEAFFFDLENSIQITMESPNGHVTAILSHFSTEEPLFSRSVNGMLYKAIGVARA